MAVPFDIYGFREKGHLKGFSLNYSDLGGILGDIRKPFIHSLYVPTNFYVHKNKKLQNRILVFSNLKHFLVN